MLLIHLVLQLWLISVNLTVCTLAYAHKHSIIHDPAARHHLPHCVPALRAYARSRCAAYARKRPARCTVLRHAMLRVARCTGRRFSSMPAQSLDQAK